MCKRHGNNQRKCVYVCVRVWMSKEQNYYSKRGRVRMFFLPCWDMKTALSEQLLETSFPDPVVFPEPPFWLPALDLQGQDTDILKVEAVLR